MKDPFDVTVLDRIGFISYCDNKIVERFDAVKSATMPEKHQNINNECWGLDVVDTNRIILRFPNTGQFEIIDITNQTVTKKIQVPGQYILYVSWFADKIYSTNWESDQVLCHDDNGRLLWCFQNAILQEPMGIATDSNGNIYVAGSSSNNVVCIDQNGLGYRVLVDKCDGLNKPNDIHYQKQLNRLLVCNRTDGKATLCQLNQRFHCHIYVNIRICGNFLHSIKCNLVWTRRSYITMASE